MYKGWCECRALPSSVSLRLGLGPSLHVLGHRRDQSGGEGTAQKPHSGTLSQRRQEDGALPWAPEPAPRCCCLPGAVSYGERCAQDRGAGFDLPVGRVASVPADAGAREAAGARWRRM